MSRPILYYLEAGPPSRSTRLVIKALNVDVEYKTVNTLKKEQLKPEFIKLNPQHTVPTLDDNGKVLWDSHAINTYLAEKYDKTGTLYPNDIYTRAVINQRLHYDSNVISPRLYAVIRAIFAGGTEIPEDALKSAVDVYDMIEIFLKDGDYLVGNNLTVADLQIVPGLSNIALVSPPTEKHPKVAAWLERLSQLPYYEDVNGRPANMLHGYLMAMMEVNKAKET